MRGSLPAPGRGSETIKGSDGYPPNPLIEFGSASWTRTNDPVINSHLLYQLSYRGTASPLL